MQQTLILPPAPALRGIVSHYWLSRDNGIPTHTVLPDGAVDLVLSRQGESRQALVYGTTTRPVALRLRTGADYFGVRFLPGQSRHLMTASAREFTDTAAQAAGLVSFALDPLLERALDPALRRTVDALLLSQLATRGTTRSPIDAAIAVITAAHGCRPIGEVAAVYPGSRRQFERAFLATVGVSAKLFSRIVRFRHAAARIAEICARPQPGLGLAAVAAECAYADQSHMNADFKRLGGACPSAFRAPNVVFLQDTDDWRARH